MKGNKTPLLVLVIYVIVQFAQMFLAKPIYYLLSGMYPDRSNNELALMAQGWDIFVTMLVGFIVILFFIKRDQTFFKNFKDHEKASTAVAIYWGILGFFLVFLGQTLGGYIESLLGIPAGSENTMQLVQMAAAAPVTVIAIALIGPILEELVFRRVLFGSLLQTTNFILAAFVSTIFFALLHFDFSHIILYAITGFTLAFIYYKTKRLLTSIIAHVLLNTFVVTVQLYREPILKFLDSFQ